MELAGLNIVMTADLGAVFSSFTQAETFLSSFADTIKNVFNGIPDLGRRLNFTTNGASQAAQDTRELANARNLDAQAALNEANAERVRQQTQRVGSQGNRRQLDEYGQLVAANQALVRAYYNEAAAQIAAGTATAEATARLEEMRRAALAGQQQLSQIEQGVGRYQRQVGNYAVGTAALAQQLRQITTEIPNFFISARIGFQSLSNNLPGIFNELTRIRQANVALAASGQPTVSVFKQFLGAFNPLNIAIGVGVGLLTLYGPKLIEMAKGLTLGGEAAQRAAKNQEDYNKATKEASKTAGEAAIKEQTNADVLYAATQNVKLSYNQRLFAAKELIAIAPFIFKGLTDEAIVAGKAAEAYDKLTQAIKDKIAVAVNEKQAETLLQQLVAAEDLVKKNSELARIQGEIAKNREADAKARGSVSLSIYQETEGAKRLSEEYKKLNEEARKLTGQSTFTVVNFPKKTEQLQAINELIDAYTKYGTKVKDINALRGKIDELFQPVTKPPKAKIDHLPEQLEKIAERIRIEWYKINEADKKGFDDFAKRQQISTLDFSPKYLQNDATGEIQSYFNNNAKAVKEGADSEARALQIDLDVWESNNVKIKEAQKKRLDALENFRQQSAAILTDTFAQTAAIIGEGIGNLLSGQSFDLFGTLGKLLADQIINFGKELIKVGALMETIQTAVKALAITGVPAIIAGGVAIGIGSALKASLSNQQKSIGKFADGGIAYGTTLGVFGEYANARSNPEVVAPLDKLQSILKKSGGGNETQVFIPEFTIKGQDLLVAMKRAEKSYQR